MEDNEYSIEKWFPAVDYFFRDYDFITTKWIHPLEEPIILSEKLEIRLDNPRTEEEINFFASLIGNEAGNEFLLNEYSYLLNKTFELHREVSNDFNSNVSSFYEKNKEEFPLKILAKMIVIIRFNSKHIPSNIKNTQHEHSETWLINYQNTVNYCNLLSILSNRQGRHYLGSSFIIESPHYEINLLQSSIRDTLRVWILMLEEFKEKQLNEFNSSNIPFMEWEFFPYYKKVIEHNSKLIELLIIKDKYENLLYIGQLLKQATTSKDEKLTFISLVSAIELLLTHNPEFNRFNVEDSINKQFILKTAIIVYNRDKSQSIKTLGDRLKVIYTQRSNIAHGNFKDFNKFLKKLREQNPEEFFVDYLEDCYFFLKHIILEYVEDSEYIEFIKEK